MAEAARATVVGCVAAIPVCFLRINLSILLVVSGSIAHLIEDVELSFRTKESGVCNAAAAQVALSLLGDVTWIAAVWFFRARMGNATNQTEGRNSGEWV